MKKRQILTTALSLATILSLTGCGGDKAVESLTIESGLEYTHLVGSDYSFDDIKVKVKWNDGSVTYVGENDLTITGFSTETAGKKKVTFSYKGKQVQVELKVTANADEVYQVNFFGTPYNLRSRTGNLEISSTSDVGFNNKDDMYVVGDDNAFEFKPVIKLLDPETQVATEFDNYTSVSTVYRKVGTEFVELNDSNTQADKKVSTYVVIDEEKSTYDFTEAAVGETFKLVVKPKFFPVGPNGEQWKQELTFEVVDGYNVHDEVQLGMMHNYDWTFNEEDPAPINTVQIMRDFLETQGLLSAGQNIPNVNGIVLHDNLVLETSDLPSEYFIIDAQTKENYGLINWLDIYCHNVLEGQKFTFYGNYYTVDASNLPLIADQSHTGSTDAYGHTQLFRIRSAPSNQTPAYSYFENVGFIGNSPNVSSEDETLEYDVEDGLRGVMLYKVQYHEATIDNVWAKDFYTVGNVESAGTTLNLNNYKSTNAYQNHLFIFGANYYDDTQRTDFATGATVNITNSVLKNAGGPAIMIQHQLEDAGRIFEDVYPVVNVDANSKIDTKLYGGEAWFSSVPFAGQSFPLINLIIGQLQAQANAEQAGTFNFMKVENGIAYVNIHTISMAAGDMSDSYTPKTDGRINLNGFEQSLEEMYTTIANIETMINSMASSDEDKIDGDKVPFITSSTGGIIMVSGMDVEEKTVSFMNLNNMMAGTPVEDTFAGFHNCEYINIYFAGMMITFRAFN